MKIMWIANIIIGALYEKLNNKKSNGLWMDALLMDFIEANEHEIVIATTSRNNKTIYLEDGKCKYYLLPGGWPIEYNNNKRVYSEMWKTLLDKEKPDIVQIWGSEFKLGLAALKTNTDIPTVIFVQGMLEPIARYYEAGIKRSELKKSKTLRDIIKRDGILQQKKKYYERSKYEKEMLELSGNVIYENIWCKTHCEAIVPNIKMHYCPISINQIFSEYEWKVNEIERNTIMCNASGYPLKGLHIIIHALELIKRSYPDVKLYVPGTSMMIKGGLKRVIKKNGYSRYIEKLIKKLGVTGNIVFMGELSSKDMASKMAISHVFVVGSAIENQSSTLKEAMLVGVPCIASMVGGIPEYVTHGKNGMLYRYEEYEMLAEYVCRIFENDEFACFISSNGKASMKILHNNKSIYQRIVKIYTNIIEEQSKKESIKI